MSVERLPARWLEEFAAALNQPANRDYAPSPISKGRLIITRIIERLETVALSADVTNMKRNRLWDRSVWVRKP